MLGCPYPLQPVQDPMTGRPRTFHCTSSERAAIAKGWVGALTMALALFIEAHGGVILTNK